MSTELQVIEIPEFLPVTKQSGIEKAEIYAATFAPFMIAVKELSTKAATINHENPSALDSKLASEIRKALVKNRTATAAKKDESKAALLAESNLIQNLHNVVINTSQLIEADLTQVEKYSELKEAARVKALHEDRVQQMQPYIENYIGFDFGKISEDQFNSIFEGAKLAAEKKEEDARLAEVARLEKEAADLAERERIRVENEKLKAEAEAKEKALAAERKAAADKLAAIEKENQAARDKAAAELKKQKEIADKSAAELKAKADAEKKAAADKLAAEKLAAKAPVKDKMRIAINGLNLVLPESEISADIMAKFNGFKNWALAQIELM